MILHDAQVDRIGQETLPGMEGVPIVEGAVLYDPDRDQSFGVKAIHVGNILQHLGSVAEQVSSSEGTIVDYDPSAIRVYYDGILTDPDSINDFGNLANSAFLDAELMDFLPKSLGVADEFTTRVLHHMVGFVGAETDEVDPAVTMSRDILSHLGAITELMKVGQETVELRFKETMAELNGRGVLMIKSGQRGPFGPLMTNLRE